MPRGAAISGVGPTIAGGACDPLQAPPRRVATAHEGGRPAVILACPDRTRENTPEPRDDTARVPLHEVVPNVPAPRQAQNRYTLRTASVHTEPTTRRHSVSPEN